LRQSELKAILEDHKLWIQSAGVQGTRANLQGVNLRGANLLDANLWDADLRGANLQGANLQGANLRCADLQGVNLQGVNLQGANLVDVNLEGAYLVGAKFSTNFKKVRWFDCATFSEDQIPWVVLHPRYREWADTLKWVKVKQLSA